MRKNKEYYEQLAVLGAIDEDEVETGAWGRRRSIVEDTKISVSDLEKKLDAAISKASEKYPDQYALTEDREDVD